MNFDPQCCLACKRERLVFVFNKVSETCAACAAHLSYKCKACFDYRNKIAKEFYDVEEELLKGCYCKTFKKWIKTHESAEEAGWIY